MKLKQSSIFGDGFEFDPEQVKREQQIQAKLAKRGRIVVNKITGVAHTVVEAEFRDSAEYFAGAIRDEVAREGKKIVRTMEDPFGERHFKHTSPGDRDEEDDHKRVMWEEGDAVGVFLS